LANASWRRAALRATIAAQHAPQGRGVRRGWLRGFGSRGYRSGHGPW
jgi:hypothetical protein